MSRCNFNRSQLLEIRSYIEQAQGKLRSCYQCQPRDEDGDTIWVVGIHSNLQELIAYDLEAPDGVMQCLTSLPMRPSGKLQLRAEVHTILAEIQALTHWRERIEQLELSETKFEKQLYAKYKGRLLDAERELGTAAGNVKQWLLAEPTVDTTTDLYARLIEILEMIEAAAKRGELHQLSTSNNHIQHAGDIVESLITMKLRVRP